MLFNSDPRAPFYMIYQGGRRGGVKLLANQTTKLQGPAYLAERAFEQE